MTNSGLGATMVQQDLGMLLSNDSAGDLLHWGSGVVCAQDFGIEATMTLLSQNRWIGRRYPWVVILDPGETSLNFEVDIDRTVYFYQPYEREVMESYRINGVQFVRRIGTFSKDFQVLKLCSFSVMLRKRCFA